MYDSIIASSIVESNNQKRETTFIFSLQLRRTIVEEDQLVRISDDGIPHRRHRGGRRLGAPQSRSMACVTRWSRHR